MTEVKQPNGMLVWPMIWLIVGLAGAAATILTAALVESSLVGLWGGITSAIAIVLTFVIARRQTDETTQLTTTVEKIDCAVVDLGAANERLYQLTLDVAEKDSAESYGITDEEAKETEDVANQDVAETGDRPSYAAEALTRLRAIGSTLTMETAHWRQKVPVPAIRGNHGWFVESAPGAPPERWYVRKGRYWDMRRAMPREFLETLETRAGIDLKTIKLDFQLKEHGLASWYARTYDGNLWKVSKSNRNPDLGIQTELVTDDPSPS